MVKWLSLNKEDKSLFKLHLAVLLFGGSSLFGKLISLDPVFITLGRMLFAALTAVLVIVITKKRLRVDSKSDFWNLVLQGIILASHWVMFFKSIQISTVTIALITFATTPIFVTFLEPFFSKHKIRLFDLAMALLTFMGVLLIVPDFDLANNTFQGAIYGLVAALLCALLIVRSKKYVAKYDSIQIIFYQDSFGMLALSPFLFYMKPEFGSYDLVLIVLLGVVFTALSGTLFVSSLRHIKAQLASITSNLEPIYGIILAALVLDEFPDLRAIMGGFLIFIAVFFATLKRN